MDEIGSKPPDLSGYVRKNDLLNLIYPVGSVYLSFNTTSPADIIGGTWVQIIGNASSDQPRFLLLENIYNQVGNTAGMEGGQARVQLTISQLPRHDHNVTVWGSGSGSYPDSANKTDGKCQAARRNGAVLGAGCNTTRTGSGEGHNNMPPYIMVYGWRRTA